MKTSIGTYFMVVAWFMYNIGSAIIDYIIVRKLLLPETTIGLIVGIVLLIGAIVNIIIVLKIVYELTNIKESQKIHII